VDVAVMIGEVVDSPDRIQSRLRAIDQSSLATSDRACESCSIFILIVLIFRHHPRKSRSSPDACRIDRCSKILPLFG
jgi:hypothetical protein